MLKLRIRYILASLLLAVLWSGGATRLLAQGQEYPATKGATARQPGIEEKLSAEELKGEGTFIQFCALCHLPRKLKTGSPATRGPILKGVFKNLTPAKEKALREFILKGTQNMPGYQYSLTSQEIDALVAYLKTR